MSDCKSDTCAGACCAAFPIHRSFFRHRTGRTKPLTPDDEFIMDMLVPLTRRQAVARSRRLGYPDPPRYGPAYSLFTCRHWDETTRLCTVYDRRPAMCSDYPYSGRTCERGCGYALPVEAEELIAEKEDSTWVWDPDANGWRPRSNTGFLWDAEAGVLRAIPKVPA